jgi:hypothetical protein
MAKEEQTKEQQLAVAVTVLKGQESKLNKSKPADKRLVEETINKLIELLKKNQTLINDQAINQEFIITLFKLVGHDITYGNFPNYESPALKALAIIVDKRHELINDDVIKRVHSYLERDDLAGDNFFFRNRDHLISLVGSITVHAPTKVNTKFILDVEKFINIEHGTNKTPLYQAFSNLLAANAGSRIIDASVIDAALRLYDQAKNREFYNLTGEQKAAGRNALINSITKNPDAWDWNHADAILQKIEELHEHGYRIDERNDYAEILLKLLSTKSALPNQDFANRLKVLQDSTKNIEFHRLLGDMRAIPVLPNAANYTRRSIFPAAKPT